MAFPLSSGADALEEFYARLSRMLANRLTTFVDQRLRQILSLEALDEAVELLRGEDLVELIASDCCDLLEVRLLQRQIEKLTRLSKKPISSRKRTSTMERIAHLEVAEQACVNSVLYDTLAPTFTRIAKEAQEEFEVFQNITGDKPVPGLDLLHMVSRLVEEVPAVFPENLQLAILNDLEVLRLGGKPSLFAKRPTGQHEGAPIQRGLQIRALAHVEFRHAKGDTKTAARWAVADAYGVNFETVRKWSERLDAEYGHYLRRYLEHVTMDGQRAALLTEMMDERNGDTRSRLITLDRRYGPDALSRDGAEYVRITKRQDKEAYA